jgi:hypothetical protein
VLLGDFGAKIPKTDKVIQRQQALFLKVFGVISYSNTQQGDYRERAGPDKMDVIGFPDRVKGVIH